MERRDSEESHPDCSNSADSSTMEMDIQTEMRVLAVDDNNIDRKLIEMLLKTSSFKVTSVNSARRALEVLGLTKGQSSTQETDGEFDLIITDYCMPEMTGYELLKRVKQENSVWRDVPVVIMSSENVPFRISRCMAEGAEEFIIKPVQLADVRRLKGHIRQARSLREGSGDSSSSPSSKRKIASQGRQVQRIERRPRLSELTVA